MKMTNVIEGLQILQKYFANPDGYHVGAAHDELYVYQPDSKVDDADAKRLSQMGWRRSDGDGWVAGT